MRFASFTREGRHGFGAVAGNGIIDLTNRLAPGVDTLKAAIAAGLLGQASRYVSDRSPEFLISDVALLPVIPDPAKILCVGMNYEMHRAETKRPDVAHPTIFVRFADSQVGHRQPLVRPSVSERFDYEGELAVIIGRGGRAISEVDAMDHVAGYACYNDASVRDWQRHTFQYTPGKNFPGTGAFGPWMASADEIGDYTKLPITTRLNGKALQQATLADLIFPIPVLISYISAFTPLSPGDVIVTGTPGGVGDKLEPPIYMKPGDVVEVDIGAVGTLVNPVMAEA